MNPTVSAVRAITAVYFRRLLLLVGTAGGILLVAAYLLVFYLASSLSPAWWFLLVALVPATLIAVAIVTVLWIASVKLLPRPLRPSERRQVSQFGSRVFGLVEQGRTPYPLMLGKIAKDVVRGRESNVLTTFIADSKALRTDFATIRQLFDIQKKD